MVSAPRPAVRLTRYLVAATLGGVLSVSALLVGLYAGIDVVREAGDLQQDYGVPEMLVFVARTLPTRVYDIFPFAALIGVLVGLGRLASGRELVAMRAAGFDRGSITLRVVTGALLATLAVVAMAELAVPRLETEARVAREQARSGSVGTAAGEGLWLRDGSRMVRVGLVTWGPDETVDLTDLDIYELDAANDSASEGGHLVRARSARHEGGEWQLRQVQRLDLDDGGVDRFDRLALASRLDPEVFDALATRPRLLPMSDILRIQDYLDRNGLDTRTYREAFWRRALYPANLLAMILVGLPFVFRPGRSASTATHVFAGVTLGVGFVVVQRISLGLAPVLPLPLGVTHALPALLFGGAGIALLRRS